MERKRIDYIDLAKGFCILLVVFTHSKEGFLVKSPLDLAMASFRMPLYFLLSGLFFKEYDGFIDFVRKKVNKLLIPFIFFYIIIALCLPLLVGKIYPKFAIKIDLNYFFCFYNENFNGMPMGIWFLWCLFIVNILFYILLMSSKHTTYSMLILTSLTILLGGIGYFLGYNRINLPLYLDTAFTSLPFFYFGYFLRKHTRFLYENKLDDYLTFLVLVCFSLVYFLAYDRLSFRKNEFDVHIFSLYLCGIIGALGILFISKKIKMLPFVSFLGRYSIMVLCSHQLVLLIVVSLLKKNNCDGWFAVLVSFILSSVISYVLIFPMKRYFPYVTAQKDLI